MNRKLYFGQPWYEPGYPDPWISFEDNPEFELTGAKSKFCRACLTSLKRGLLSYEGGGGVNVGPGAYCWKTVIGIEGMQNAERVKDLLIQHQDDFLSGETGIHGKAGGGEVPSQQEIMLHCDSQSQAEAYKDSMRIWLAKHHRDLLNSYSVEQGCKHPFLELFGPVLCRKEWMVPRSSGAVQTVLNVYLQDSALAQH